MADLSRMLDQFLGASAPQSAAPQTQAAGQPAPGNGFDLSNLVKGPGGLATGAAIGGLAGLLLGGKKPKKIAKTALQAGGVALVGGLAYKAYQNWQAQKTPQAAAVNGAAAPIVAPPSHAPTQVPAPPVGSGFLPAAQEEKDDLSRMLMRAMIAAAKADGHINEDERAKIGAQLSALDLDTEDSAFVEQELAKPLDIDAVAGAVKSPEQAAEIYAASLLVIDRDAPAERGYLGMLAARLNLDPDLITELHNAAESVQER